MSIEGLEVAIAWSVSTMKKRKIFTKTSRKISYHAFLEVLDRDKDSEIQDSIRISTSAPFKQVLSINLTWVHVLQINYHWMIIICNVSWVHVHLIACVIYRSRSHSLLVRKEGVVALLLGFVDGVLDSLYFIPLSYFYSISLVKRKLISVTL